jgi:hypothetical protein
MCFSHLQKYVSFILYKNCRIPSPGLLHRHPVSASVPLPFCGGIPDDQEADPSLADEAKELLSIGPRMSALSHPRVQSREGNQTTPEQVRKGGRRDVLLQVRTCNFVKGGNCTLKYEQSSSSFC